jgi:WD40 repeat protein
MAEKLTLEASLHGHQGCVNRLAWNEDGSLLASASDDCQVSQADSPDGQCLSYADSSRRPFWAVQSRMIVHRHFQQLPGGAYTHTAPTAQVTLMKQLLTSGPGWPRVSRYSTSRFHHPSLPFTQVLLWRYPDHQALPLVLETEHHANLFGVKFLPNTSNTRLVTGAMDYTVQLHELEAAPLSHPPQYSSRVWPGRPAAARRAAATPVLQSQRVPARHSVYNCHTSRVKVRWCLCICVCMWGPCGGRGSRKPALTSQSPHTCPFSSVSGISLSTTAADRPC